MKTVLEDDRASGLSCAEVNAFLADYADGGLQADVCSRFEAHVERCASCRTYLDQYRNTIQMVKGCGDEPCPPPEPLVEATLQFLREHWRESE